MKIYPDCGYFNEEKYDEYSPYPGECEDCYRYAICSEAKRKESAMEDNNILKITEDGDYIDSEGNSGPYYGGDKCQD